MSNFDVECNVAGATTFYCLADLANGATGSATISLGGDKVTSVVTSATGTVTVTFRDTYKRFLFASATYYGEDDIQFEFVSEDVDHATVPVMVFSKLTQSTDAALAAVANTSTADKVLFKFTMQENEPDDGNVQGHVIQSNVQNVKKIFCKATCSNGAGAWTVTSGSEVLSIVTEATGDGQVTLTLREAWGALIGCKILFLSPTTDPVHIKQLQYESEDVDASTPVILFSKRTQSDDDDAAADVDTVTGEYAYFEIDLVGADDIP